MSYHIQDDDKNYNFHDNIEITTERQKYTLKKI
jgi:hypothetical protein